MKIQSLILGVCLSLVSTISFAQNNVWYFGAANGLASSFGLDFTGGGTPVTRNFESALDYYESVTVVSDAAGDILYYSDGREVMDASHNIIAGAPATLQGAQDGNSGSSVQGAFSMLKPGSLDEYYLFTTQSMDGLASGFRLNRIDMSLPGNGTVGAPLGEMVTSDSVIVATGTELLTAYGNCGTDSVWLVTHSPESYDFISVLVTSNGIQSVTTQNIPTPTLGGNPGFLNAKGRGSMDISPDGTKLIFTAMHGAGSFILDFDKNTGTVSNPIEVEIPHGFWGLPTMQTFEGYGCEFSPNSDYAYFSAISWGGWGYQGIWQYDVVNNIVREVPTSSGGNYGEIITGPDNKLYIGKVSQEASLALAVMDNPDLASAVGNTVGFDPDAISFPNSATASVSYAMPQGFFCAVQDTCDIDPVASLCDTVSPFQLTGDPEGSIWGGGAYITSGGLFDPGAAGGGTHWVTNLGGCLLDSMEITVTVCCPDLDPDFGPDTTICDDATQTLNAGAGLDSYRWYENGTLLVTETESTLEADSGTYVVVVEDVNGCTGTDTIEIGNHQLPTPDLGPDTFYCATADVTVDAGPGYASYAWSPSGGSGQTAIFSSANTYTVTVVDGNGCEGTDDIIISESALPSPTIDGGSIVCEDSSTVLTGSAAGTSTFSWTGFGAVNPISVTTGGTYTFVETDVNGCIDSVSQVVTFENAPAVDLEGPFQICRTQEFQNLDANTGASGETYLWNTGSTDSIISASDAGSFSVIVTSASGCIAYDTAIVDTFSLPTVDLGPDTFFCAGLSFDLDAGAGFNNYAWTPSGSGQTNTVTSAATYEVTVTDVNGCTATDQAIVSENELPTVDLGGDTTVCEADSIDLDATHADAASYLWTPNGEISAQIRVGATAATYGVTVTDVDGCEFSTSRTITQADLPIVDLGANDTICEDLTITLDAGAGTGLTYEWLLDNVVIGSETEQTLEADSGTYIVNVSTILGCEASDTIEIDNHQLPTVDLGGDDEFCEGDSVILYAANATASFVWTPGGSIEDSLIVYTTGTFEVTVTDTNGCINSNSVVVTRNDLPVVDLGGDEEVCADYEVTLDADNSGSTYVWDDVTETGQTRDITVGFGTYWVEVTDVNNCVNSDTIVFSPADVFEATIEGDSLICSYETASLSVTTEPAVFGATYDWTGATGGQTGITSTAGIVSVIVTDISNCKDTASTTVTVNVSPNASFELEVDSFCSLGQEVYTAVLMVDNDSTSLDYNSIDFYTFQGENQSNNTREFTYAPTTVFASYTDTNNCKTEDTLRLVEYCEPTIIELPNIFVPGGGVTGNTTFRPINLTDETFINLVNNIVWSDFQVFNRWGLKVYQSEDIIPNWDGIYENRPTASGVYYWIYKYKDSSLKEYSLNGFVQVVQQRD